MEGDFNHGLTEKDEKRLKAVRRIYALFLRLPPGLTLKIKSNGVFVEERAVLIKVGMSRKEDALLLRGLISGSKAGIVPAERYYANIY